MTKTKQTKHEATTPEKPSRFLNKKEVAELLGVGLRTVERMGRAGKLPTLTLTPRIIRFDRDVLIAQINSRFGVKEVNA